MKLRWGDFIIFFIVASVIVLMLVLSAPKETDENITAQIIQNGEIVYEIDLSSIESQEEYLLDDGDVVIIAEEGRIRFIESDCPNQICVHTGWIDKTNEISACLPNKILIKLVGGEEEVDVVVK